jgi:poly(glycerol-phosphate) alpha-glucosyltransferase
LVVSIHGMIEPWAQKNSKWKKRAAWFAYQSENLKQAGCIIVASQTEAGYVHDCKVTTPIAVIPNGVDLAGETNTGPAWQNALGAERRVLLFLGRIHPKKGVFELVRAWAQFVNSYPDRARNWSLVVTGWDDGGHDGKLRALAHTLGLSAPTFHMTGPLFGPDRDAALAHAHAFVLPSHSEGMPLAALEAMATGLPLLLTVACNLPQVTEAGAGLRIGPTVNGICDGIVRLAALTGEQHADMAHRAKELAQQVFTWPRAARDTARVYSWLLGAGPRPSDLLA